MARPPKAKAIERLQGLLEKIPVLKQRRDYSPEFTKWRRDTEIAIERTFDEDATHVEDFHDINFLDYVEGLESARAILESMIDEIKEYWEDEKLTAASVLRAIRESEEPGEKEHQTPSSPPAQENERTNTKEVFVIHGRDNEAKETVARFLTRLDLTPVILHEQPNLGRTIIEKFERHARVGFAVALLTPDDVGALKGDEKNLKPRARENVVFELGYFLGRLGRERVCALTKGNVEIPSDYDGVIYISLDDGGWKMDLIRELKNVGFAVDANRAL